jgi:hypothetical protein
MARSNLLIALERQYARLLGRYEVAEQAVETVYGLHAVLAKWDEIESDKKLLKRKMEQVAGTIMQFDPAWVAERVKPIHPKARFGAVSSISRSALSFMRTEAKPLSIRQISRAVAHKLKMTNPTERDIARIDIAVYGALKTRQGKTVICEGEKPKLWRLVARDKLVARAAEASGHAAASSPSNHAKLAA